MLSKLETFINKHLKEPAINNDSTEEQIMISTAVLFLEMAYADFDISSEEETHMIEILHELFNLDSDEIDELINTAKESRSDRPDIWMFTDLLKTHFNREQKIRILENLWRLIFADGRIDRYEDALIRKITTLLGLEHGDMIQTKLKVKNN
jgi:uncharacterized tellurite resistance protein B-like protein